MAYTKASKTLLGRQTKDDLLREIRKYVSLDSISATTLRGQPKDSRRTVIDYLEKIDLSSIPRLNRSFLKWLERETNYLMRKLPKKKPEDRPWGVARKALNLYLRGCLYNYYLRKEYHLENIEPLLEVPLDKKVGKALIKFGNGLPSWPGLRKLKKPLSDSLQNLATMQFQQMKLPARIFLDHYHWNPKTENRTDA